MKSIMYNAADGIRKHPSVIAWVLTGITVLLAFFAWGDSHSWHLAGLSTYYVFPLFGLVAFSVLWCQYVLVALCQLVKIGPAVLGRYFALSGLLVLVVLLLHPGLLSYQLWRDGFGLPPESIFRHYVMPGLGWVVLLGMVSWLIFVFYVVSSKYHRLFRKRTWWRWFGYAGQVAMFAVFYHGLRLGGQLQEGWFHKVWIGYGVIFVLAITYLNVNRLRRQRLKSN